MSCVIDLAAYRHQRLINPCGHRICPRCSGAITVGCVVCRLHACTGCMTLAEAIDEIIDEIIAERGDNIDGPEVA